MVRHNLFREFTQVILQLSLEFTQIVREFTHILREFIQIMHLGCQIGINNTGDFVSKF